MRTRLDSEQHRFQLVRHLSRGEGVCVVYSSTKQVGHRRRGGCRHQRQKTHSDCSSRASGYRAIGIHILAVYHLDVKFVGAVMPQRVAHRKEERQVAKRIRVVGVVDRQHAFKSLSGHGHLLCEAERHPCAHRFLLRRCHHAVQRGQEHLFYRPIAFVHGCQLHVEQSAGGVSVQIEEVERLAFRHILGREPSLAIVVDGPVPAVHIVAQHIGVNHRDGGIVAVFYLLHRRAVVADQVADNGGKHLWVFVIHGQRVVYNPAADRVQCVLISFGQPYVVLVHVGVHIKGGVIGPRYLSLSSLACTDDVI